MGARVFRLAEKTDAGGFMARSVTMTWDLRYQPRDFLDVIAVVGAGGGRHVVRDDSGRTHHHTLRAGDLVLYRPRDDISLFPDPADGLSILFMSFPLADWQTLAAIAGLDPAWLTAEEPPLVAFDPEDAELPALFQRAIESTSRGPTGREMIGFWLEAAAYLFPPEAPGSPERSAPVWLVDAIDAMNDEENMRGGVHRLHELAHVSASHLSITSRRYFGITPSSIVAEIRLRHAAMLLVATSESVETIARRCGFASFSYFSTSFRRQYLISPSAYRSRARGEPVRGRASASVRRGRWPV